MTSAQFVFLADINIVSMIIISYLRDILRELRKDRQNP